MKKILYSVMAMAALTFSFTSITSCEDVPAPYEIPTDGDDSGKDDSGDTTVEPTGTGSKDDPYNVAGALKYISDGGDESTEVYVKGKVVSVVAGSFDSSYGSLKYYISDDGTETNKFYVFNGYAGPNRTKFSGEDALKAGDEVVICGKLVTYNGTKEFTTGNYIVSLNGNGSGSDSSTEGTATGEGTKDSPYNSVAANKFASSLAADAESENDVYVKGKVVSITQKYSATTYGTATFYISDDGKADNQFCVYRALYLNNEKYTSGTDINVGDDVVVCGKVTNYKGNTPETVSGKAYLVSLTSNSSSDDKTNPDEDVTGNKITVAPADLGISSGSSVGTVTLSDGTQLSFNIGTNSKNDPKFYTTGNNIRMYPGNTMTVKSSKKIKSITINCDTYQGTICNASGDVSANPGSVAVSGDVLTISNINATETVFSNTSTTTGTASQVRITSIVIYYAD